LRAVRDAIRQHHETLRDSRSTPFTHHFVDVAEVGEIDVIVGARAATVPTMAE